MEGSGLPWVNNNMRHHKRVSRVFCSSLLWKGVDRLNVDFNFHAYMLLPKAKLFSCQAFLLSRSFSQANWLRVRQRWRIYRECIDTFLADESNILANIPANEHSRGFIRLGSANGFCG